MDIIIFGASGPTGRELIRAAVAQGHTVTAFVRHPATLTPGPQVTIEVGDVTRKTDIDAVLAQRPYAVAVDLLAAKSLTKSDPALVEATRNLVRSAAEHGVGKLLHVSFIGANPQARTLSLLYRFVIPLATKALVADHRAKDRIVREGGVNWTIVQAPSLTDDPASGTYEVNLEVTKGPKRRLTLGRADLADFLVKQFASSPFDRRTVFVTK